ncbi:VCBS repeat-containing protein [bacterium CPR1]|nr:VCBS repeat-containing protein [bacterium CPR1]
MKTKFWLLVVLLALPLLGAPPLRPEQTMVLVVGPTSNPIHADEQAVVNHLNDTRKRIGLTQLLLATMHFDQPVQAKICRESLGITESDLICLAVVQLDLKTRRPVKTLSKVSRITPASLDQVETTLRRWASESGVSVPGPALDRPGKKVALEGGVDLNGDGVTDVLAIKNGRWLVSYSGSKTYSEVNRSSQLKIDQLGFGDFNGDGRTDILAVPTGGTWRVSLGGVGPLSQWNSMKEIPRLLRFADLDGYGRTDIFDPGKCFRNRSSRPIR